MFRSCSISVREGTSPVHVSAPSCSSASAPDMLRARERPRSEQPEGWHRALGSCQPPGLVTGEVPEMGWGRCWAAAPVAEPSHPCTVASPESPPQGRRSPVHCSDRHRQLERCVYQTRRYRVLTVSSLLPRAPPGPHRSATQQTASVPGASDTHRNMAMTVLRGVPNTAVLAVSEVWPFITSN